VAESYCHSPLDRLRRDKLPHPARKVADALDDWLLRCHGIISSAHSVGLLLDLLADEGLTVAPEPLSNALDAAMGNIWLIGNWRTLTTPMASEEREAAAAAVLRWVASTDDGELSDDSLKALRWWADGGRDA